MVGLAGAAELGLEGTEAVAQCVGVDAALRDGRFVLDHRHLVADAGPGGQGTGGFGVDGRSAAVERGERGLEGAGLGRADDRLLGGRSAR